MKERLEEPRIDVSCGQIIFKKRNDLPVQVYYVYMYGVLAIVSESSYSGHFKKIRNDLTDRATGTITGTWSRECSRGTRKREITLSVSLAKQIGRERHSIFSFPFFSFANLVAVFFSSTYLLPLVPPFFLSFFFLLNKLLYSVISSMPVTLFIYSTFFSLHSLFSESFSL